MTLEGEDLSLIAAEVLKPLQVDSYNRFFTELEYSRGLDYYLERLKAIRFVNRKRVLDAACGVGQWSLALALLNERVQGIDLKEVRIKVAQRLCAVKDASNASFMHGSIEALPYPAESFDAIFCYGAWMFTNAEKTLGEFARVLSPGGVLYICANGLGVPLHFMIRRGLLGQEAEATQMMGGRHQVLRSNWGVVKRTLRSWIYRQGHVPGACLSEQYVRYLFKTCGLDIKEFRGDGEIGRAKEKLSGNSTGHFYPARFLGFWCVFELIAEKLPQTK
jgi:ubiquinone/menaquinone biosynthesis C-methylase UbiE